MDTAAYEKRIAELERENRILKQKLTRSETERKMLEEVLETHSNALKIRNAELEESRKQLIQSEAKYRNLAHHDILTGLPNRAFLYERLERILVAGSRCSGALFYMDLDRFKSINDGLGHCAGDFVLCEASRRLLSCARGEDTVSRIGGDEFAMLIPGIIKVSVLSGIAEKIITGMAEPFNMEEYVFRLGISIGISVYPEDTSDAAELLHKADAAMYTVKKNKSSRYLFYRDVALSIV